MNDVTLKHSNPTYTSMNEHGLIEVRDLITDELIFYQKSLNDEIMHRSDLVEIKTTDGASVLCERGIDPAMAPSHKGKWTYSETMTELIVDAIADGHGITKLPEGLPTYGTIWRWRRQFPEFDEALAIAMKMKSDRFLQQIEDENHDIDKVDDMIELNSKKAKIDNMKWLAEKHDPQRFGKTREKNEAGALTIIVNTGIVREDDRDTAIEATVVKDNQIGTRD